MSDHEVEGHEAAENEMDNPEVPPVRPVKDKVQSSDDISHVPLVADKEMEEFQNEHHHEEKSDGATQEMNDFIITLEHKGEKDNQGTAGY
jgi:hypothetical protein